MRRHIPLTGMALVVAGAILLMVSFPTGWKDHNAVLLTGWGMVTVGIILHVWFQKRYRKY